MDHLNQRGRQFSRLLAAKVFTSAVVMVETPCSKVVWRVLANHSIRQFPLHVSSRVSPCAITFQLESKTPLAHCRDLYLAAHNTHKRQTSMPLEGFEPTISASEQQQTHTFDHAATGIGHYCLIIPLFRKPLRSYTTDCMQNGNQLKLQMLFFVSSTFKFTVTLTDYTVTQCQTISCN